MSKLSEMQDKLRHNMVSTRLSVAESQFIAAEIDRIQNVTKQALLAQRAAEAQLIKVGVAGSMPGTSGFTMGAFKADDVPLDTPLYILPRVKD